MSSPFEARNKGDDMPVSRWPGKLPLLNYAVIPTIASFVLCVAIFVWASAKGFDVSDDAAHLLWAARPFSFKISLSQYGYLWHPVYELVGGDVRLFRIAGLAALLGCGALFGNTLARFLGGIAAAGAGRLVVMLSIATCLFWQFEQWLPSPGYDELNLCAILVFFAGLLGFSTESETRSIQSETMLSVGSGVALGVIALTKPTTCLATLLLGIAWIVLVRPRHALLGTGVAAAFACVTVLIAVAFIDGSLLAFVRRNFMAYQYMRARDSGSDIHGMARSIIHPFASERGWRAAQALAEGFLGWTLATGCLASALDWNGHHKWLRRPFELLLFSAFVILIAVSRAIDLGGPAGWWGFRDWHFALPFVLLSVPTVLALRGTDLSRADRWKVGAVAVVLALAPFAYSIGTNNTLIFHMSSASVLWAAVALMLSSFATMADRDRLLYATGWLCCAGTIGMLAGMAVAPGRIGPPLWDQSRSVILGPGNSTLELDPESADYLATLRAAAQRHGFTQGTPMVEISGIGPGVVFALGGNSLGVPWLLADGPDSVASSRLALRRVPLSDLRGAWVITGDAASFVKACTMLQSLNVRFPEDYDRVATLRHNRFGWQQTLWKPHASAKRTK